MSSIVDTTHESSVMFNLRQLMHLEQERIAEEEQRAHEQRTAEERAQLRALAEAAERVRVEDAARQRASLEREAVLLRVQLEAAAAERAREADLELAHAHALAAVQMAYRARSARLLRRTAPLVVVCLGLAAAGTCWANERGRAAEESARVAVRRLTDQTQVLRNVNAQLTRLSAPRQPALSVLAAQPSPGLQPSAPTKPKPPPHTAPRIRPFKAQRPNTPDESDGLGRDSLDPIDGLSNR